MSQLISSLPRFFLRLFIFTSIFYTPILFSQSDLTFISQTDYAALHNTGLNDIWGYVDEQGNEYAIVGTEDGTSIMNVSDPANPFEVFWLPGENSTHRDPTVFGDYAYISTEAEEGLTIINLSPLPESNVLVTTLFTGESGLSWESAHNCHVDDAGYLSTPTEEIAVTLGCHINCIDRTLQALQVSNYYVSFTNDFKM
mgnify:CR=1 FL=1